MIASRSLVLALEALREPAADARSGFAWIDIVVLGFVVLGLVLGVRRGLWWQFVRLLGLVASLCVARALAPRLAPGLIGIFDSLSPAAANGILWSAILILGWILVAIVGRIGREAIDAAQLSALDRAGGAVVGALSALLVAFGLLVCVAQLASPGWTEKNLRGTNSQVVIDGFARSVPGVLDELAAERAAPEVWAAESRAR